MEISIAIVEDDPLFALDAERIVSGLGYHVQAHFESSDEALPMLLAHTPDILIADVFPFGSRNGIQMVEALQLPQLPVIFCTSSNLPELYLQAKRLPQRVAYLIKPFDAITLQDAIERAVASLDKTFDVDAPLGTEWDGAALVGDCFFIKENQKLKKVAFKDIAWMEADGNYTMIQTTERKYALKKSLVSVKSQLPPDKFIQIQKGCVVRLAAIDSIDIGQGTVKVGQVDLPLGKTFKDDLLLHFKRV